MRLHARNVASAAGVPPGMIERIAEEMSKEGNITAERARALTGAGDAELGG
jgi:hydroxymethylglutaryl-CoA reductase